MNPLFEAALEFERFFQQRGWRFCIVGGLAVQRWGRPRATEDVDIALLTGFGDEERFIEDLLKHFRSRASRPAAFAIARRVLLLLATNDIGVDVALAGIPFEEEAIARATPFEFLPGVVLTTCSAEDLVVLKAFAARPLDWFDVEGILARQFGRLDWAYIQAQLAPLCAAKQEPEIVDRLKELRKKIETD